LEEGEGTSNSDWKGVGLRGGFSLDGGENDALASPAGGKRTIAKKKESQSFGPAKKKIETKGVSLSGPTQVIKLSSRKERASLLGKFLKVREEQSHGK